MRAGTIQPGVLSQVTDSQSGRLLAGPVLAGQHQAAAQAPRATSLMRDMRQKRQFPDLDVRNHARNWDVGDADYRPRLSGHKAPRLHDHI
jgi:hypothetical protein